MSAAASAGIVARASTPGGDSSSMTGAMLPWSIDFAGRLDEHVVESELLRENPLGDPHRRPLWVYVPPGYDDEPGRRYPSIYVLQGLTGQLDMWRNRVAFRRNFPELLGELAPACVVVFVDAWTSLGGSQFIDSPGTGRYGSYLCDEVVGFVDERYRTLASPEHRGVAGKSSGGYGAMVTPMLRPDRFGALATHAGDALFEVCYLPDFREAARALRDQYDGSFDRFWADFRSRPHLRRRGNRGRAVPRPRRGGLPPRARRDRRHRRLLRALRRRPREHRVPLPAGPEVPRGTLGCVASGLRLDRAAADNRGEGIG